MAFGHGVLWVSTDARLYRLDPSNARVVGASVPLQAASVALAVVEGRETAITRLDLAP